MKKIKLLSPLLAIATISSSLIPLTSCGCKSTSTSHLKYIGAKYLNIEHNQTIDINIILDKIYTKQDITNIQLVTSIDNFLSYTYDINDTVLTLHITQVKEDMDDKEIPLEIKISTSNWTDAVIGITLNYSLAHETGLRGYAFEKTTLTYKLANDTIDIRYSFDNKSWKSLSYSSPEPITIEKGQFIWFRGKNDSGLCPSQKPSEGTNLVFTNANEGKEEESSINLVGQINALLYDGEAKTEETLPDYAFTNLFNGSVGLGCVPNDFLPSTKLSQRCYQSLFEYCKNISIAPALPAEELTSGCYWNMFSGCECLVSAPELPATKLADNCYNTMFQYCGSIVNAPKLPATTVAEKCYYQMFRWCTSLTTPPELKAEELAPYCYYAMFQLCVSLAKAPELPATTLAENCYAHMFDGCDLLIIAPDLPAQTLATSCYQDMFRDCVSLVVAPIIHATTLAKKCCSEMFYQCWSLTEAPELPVEKLYQDCYMSMFYECKSLQKAPELPATELASGCYYSMFSDCTSLEKAPNLPAKVLKEACYNEMFQNCTKLVDAPILSYTSYDNAPGCCYAMFKNCISLVKPPVLPITTSQTKTNEFSYMFYGCSKLKIRKVSSQTAEGFFFYAPTDDLSNFNEMFGNINQQSEFKDGTPDPDAMYAWYE